MCSNFRELTPDHLEEMKALEVEIKQLREEREKHRVGLEKHIFNLKIENEQLKTDLKREEDFVSEQREKQNIEAERDIHTSAVESAHTIKEGVEL